MNLHRGLLTVIAAVVVCAVPVPAAAAEPDTRHSTAISNFYCFPQYGTEPVFIVWCGATVVDTSSEPTPPTGSVSVTFPPHSGGSEYALSPAASGSASVKFGFSTFGGQHTVIVSYPGDSEHAPSTSSQTFVTAPRYAQPEPEVLPPDPEVLAPDPEVLAPETWFRRTPPRRTKRHRATFVFRGAYGDRYECKLDKRSFRPCPSKFSRRVRVGRHRLAVRTVAATGMVDPSPANFRWRVVRR